MNHNPLFKLFVISAMLGLILSACTATPAAPANPTASAPTAAPTAAATLAPTAMPTEAPTAAPTLAPTAVTGGKSVDAEGISFRYDPTLASSVGVQRVPATTEDLPFYGVKPEHLEVSFEGYPVKSYEPQIKVFSLDAYLQQGNASQFLVDQANAVRSLLAEQPDLNQKYSVYIGMDEANPAAMTPPVVPPLNARIAVAAKKSYVGFANGSGRRFVLWASQAMMYVDPGFLFYRYQGLTSDGKHYVVATFAVHAPIDGPLPTPDANTTAADIEAFNRDMAQRIETADPSAFTPPLPLLDATMQSLQVGPAAP